MLANAIIIAAVIAIVILGIRRIVGTATGTRDCCSGDRRGGRAFRATRVRDRDESHYPYVTDLRISGMSCESCATRVARALDSVAGTWATVDLSSRTAHVRSKTPIDLDADRSVVSEAGYRVVV